MSCKKESGVSHWGFHADGSSCCGGGSCASPAKVKNPFASNVMRAIVLTGAGEVLIHRNAAASRLELCEVAIIIDRTQHALTRPQAERMQKAWDTALALVEGDEEAVTLQPVPHHWRFSRVDYLTIGEWRTQMSPSEHHVAATGVAVSAQRLRR